MVVGIQRGVVAAALALGLAAPVARATPRVLTAAERAEITALARSFFEATRDGAGASPAVYPTPAELRGLFPPMAPAAPGAPHTAVDELVGRHFAALERDATALRELFRAGTFVGIAGPVAEGRPLDVRRCGRFARADTQCGDGPVILYDVGGARRRFRIDTLVRLRGRWRVFDARH